MAWIESHQALGQHPKTIRFAELLHVSLPTAVGHLHYFWWWALDFAPTGEIHRASPTVLARACQWRGNPERFWQALVEAGFVDATDVGMWVHDWLDYAGRLVEKRAVNRERQRRHRHAENGVTSRVTNADVGVTNASVTRESRGYQPDQPTGDFVPLTNQPTGPDQPYPPGPPSDPPKGACCLQAEITSGRIHADECSNRGS